MTLERIMRVKDGGLTPTRFSLKVATGRKFSRKTSRRLSPVVVPLSSAKIVVPGPSGGSGGSGGGAFVPSNDCDNDGTPNSSDASSDPDLLSDALERSLKTDPCDADTDGDGAEDGYEYRSALDLNHFPRTPPYPFPGRRPYPNPLDPSDGNIDYDGDSLTVREEFLAWFRFSDDGVRRPGRPTGDITNPGTFMLYSDGLQRSKEPPPRRLPDSSTTGSPTRTRTTSSGTTSATPTTTASATTTSSTASSPRRGGPLSTTGPTSPRSRSTRISISSTSRTCRCATRWPTPTWTATR